MEIQITCRNVSLTEVQMEYAEHRLRIALGRFESTIRSARVTLTDVDGPGDGSDILCRLKVILKKKGDIIVGDPDVSVEAAVANVADRGARSLARLLDRRRNYQGILVAQHPASGGLNGDARRLRDEI